MSTRPAGRHRRSAALSRPPSGCHRTRTPTRRRRHPRQPLRHHLATSFPALLGPGRRAAWRRYCLRRATAALLALAGCGLVFLAGAAQAPLA